MKNKYRSNLSIAKNLGASGSGSGHWWHQRVTAVILTIATLWLFSFSWALSGSEVGGAIHIVKKPYNLIMLVIFAVTGFYHAALGMVVVIEDYVHCRILKLISVLSVQIFSMVTLVSFIIAAIYIMNI